MTYNDGQPSTPIKGDNAGNASFESLYPGKPEIVSFFPFSPFVKAAGWYYQFDNWAKFQLAKLSTILK